MINRGVNFNFNLIILISYDELSQNPVKKSNVFSIPPFYFQRIVFWQIWLFRQKGYLEDVSVEHTYIISIHVARITYDGVWKTYINQNVIGINHVIDYIIHIFKTRLDDTNLSIIDLPQYHGDYMIKYDIYSYLLR